MSAAPHRTPRAVLAIASECAPLVKTGGLADVVGALPAALAGEGWAVRTLIPGYPRVLSALRRSEPVLTLPDLLGVEARVLAARHAGLDLLILDAPALYDRPGGPYLDAQGADWEDNDLRFAALSLAGAAIAAGALKDWVPELVHLHDWQAGFAPVYMRELGCTLPSVMTIHNMAFHGLTRAGRMHALGLPAGDFHVDGFEFYGHVSALKAGLTAASAITTVSPTYARELTTPEFGYGLDGVIRARASRLYGILNGIDTEAWNPASDTAVKPFASPGGKAVNKRLLREEFGLDHRDGPLAVVVSRLSDQKGLDLLLAALPALTENGGQLALLGSGDRTLERDWQTAADAHPGVVGVRIGYDETLSHLLYAAADAVLVPSRFEPCGLTQLYGLRYGALPVVARTGGLADTVIDANAAALSTGCATGIVHDPHSIPALSEALERLCTLWGNRTGFLRMQRNAMKFPVGWEASAPRYAEVFAALTGAGAADETDASET